jgi:hypothetical protein
MGRVKPLIRPDPRETELLGEIGRAQSMTKKSYRYLCKRAGLSYATFMSHKKNIRNMRHGELWAFLDACKREMEYV